MAEAVPKVTVKLKLPNGDVHRAIKSDPTQQARAETKTDELEKEKEEGEGEECSQRKESSPNLEAGSPSALHPERARGQGESGSNGESDEESDVTKSDDEDVQRVAHISSAFMRGGRGRGGRGGRVLGPGLGRRKKIEKKKQKAPQTEKKKPVYLRPLLPGEVVWAKIPSYPWWPAQVLTPQEEHQRLRHKKTDIFVVFFGDQSQCSWLKRDKVEPWTCPEYSDRIAKQNKGLQVAIEEALVAINQDMNSGDQAEPETEAGPQVSLEVKPDHHLEAPAPAP